MVEEAIKEKTETTEAGLAAPDVVAAVEKQPKSAKKSGMKLPDMKLFGKWDSAVEVNDPGLRSYVNLKPRLVPKSSGALQKHRFYKSKMHIVERLALHLLVSGHAGRKHRLSSGRFGGGYTTVLKSVEKALEIIEKKENKNPIEVMVRAIENAAMREEIMTYQMGSVVARDSVISAPQRRVDKVLRNFAQGSYRKSFGKNTTLADAIATELIAASKNSTDSFAVKEKDRVEREALGAR